MPDENNAAVVVASTEDLIKAAVKFALDGKKDEGWTSKHQHRAVCWLIANECGGEVKDYLDDGNITMAAIKWFGNASANRQTLEKAKVINETASGKGTKKTNLFAGFSA